MLSGNQEHRTLLSNRRIRLFLPALLLLCTLNAQAQTDLLTFTGVWTNVPVTGLSSARSIVGDAAGNLYISDFSLTSIVKIAPDGTQSTVGSGLSDPSGLAIDSAQDLYVASNGDNKVYRINNIGGAQSPIGSGWSSPVSVAVDSSGNVFVSDSSGLSEVTYGGSQSLLVSAPSLQGLTIDRSDNVYYGDNNNSSVYEVLAGTTTVIRHNSLTSIRNLYIDAQGSVYMAQTLAGAQRSDDNSSDTTFGDTLITEGVWGNSHNLYLLDASGVVEKIALGAVDFGSVNLCPGSNVIAPCTASQTLHFALDNNVYGSATTRSVTQGTPGYDYAITADTCTGTFTSGGSCSLTLTFTPMEVGARPGAAQVIGETTVNNIAPPVGPQPQARPPAQVARPFDQPPGTLLSSVLLHGVGIGPVGVFDTAPIQTFPFTPFSNSYLYGAFFDVRGELFVTDNANCVVQGKYANTSTVIAGTVCGADAGDGGQADMATLDGPTRAALDGAGNLFIVDNNGHTIRRVDRVTGLITTVAGNGSSGYSGDGGPATSASFHYPVDIVLDPGGNLLIADQDNNAVRRVDAFTGIVTTIAGSGPAGYSGDGGAATSAQLNHPDALALDTAGNLYIGDDQNNAIRKVAGGVITTVAGTGPCGYSGDGGPAVSAQLCDPEGVAVDPAGNIYVAESVNHIVRKVDGTSGIISTAVGTFIGPASADERYTGDGGPATLAGLSYNESVAVDPYGEILIADSDNKVIRIVVAPVGLAGFGSVAIGSSSAAQLVHMSNAGNSSLTLNALQIPTDYSLVGADTTCIPATVLAVNAACAFSMKLTPTADGSRNNVLVVTDDFYNELGTTQIIVLSGTGTGPIPAKLAFAAPIAAIPTGGNPGVVALDIEDVNGTLITGATSLVTLTITGPGGYSQTRTVTAVNGVATFDLTSLPLTTLGAYAFTATSSSLTQAVDNASVIANTPGPAQLAIPSSVTTTIPVGGSPGVVPVRIENSSASLVTNATNPVTLTITGPGGYSHVVTVSAASGIASFDLTALALTVPGVYTLTATSNELAPATATVTVTVASPSAAQLAIAGTLPAVVPSGANLGIVPVDINTGFGTLASGATNTVTLTVSGPGGFVHVVTVAAVNGVASFDLNALPLIATGTYTLTATSTGLTQAQATVTVTTGTVTTTPVQLQIPPSVPAMVASGGDLGIVPVDIDNSEGLVIPGAGNTVTLTISGPGGFTYTATVTAVNGVASFDLSAVVLTTPGTYTLTATSGRLTQALASVTVSTDFTIAVSSSSQATVGPIAPGAAATFSFTLAPASGDFPAAIALTATGLPPGSTFSFAPAAVTPGTNAVATALAIQTSRTASAALAQSRSRLWGWGPVALGLLLLPISGSRRMRSAFRRLPIVSVALLLLAFGSVAGLAGCGAGGLFGHPQQSYTITVTGTSGSIHHSATVTLSVE